MAVKAPTSVNACRSRFPIFERLTYINSCSQGALSDSVRAAYADYLTGWDERGAPWEYWVERAETARATFARFVGGEPDDVAVTTSLSAGVSPLASALDFTSRPKVVISDFEFPTIGQIWHAQELRGAEVVHVHADGAEIPVERFDEAIDEQTAVVSIAAVCYRNGSRLAVEEIAKIAHERGALVVLDAYQAIGTYPLDVRELGVDVLAAGVLKYLLGSAGLGFMWTRPGSQRAAAADADRLVRRPRHLRDGHHRLLAVADGAAVPVGHAAGPGDLCGDRRPRADGGDRRRRDAWPRTALNERLIEGVDELGGVVVTPRDPERRGALVCIRSTDAPQLVAALEADGHRHLGARRQPAGLRARLQHRRGHRRGARRRWHGTAGSSLTRVSDSLDGVRDRCGGSDLRSPT